MGVVGRGASTPSVVLLVDKDNWDSLANPVESGEKIIMLAFMNTMSYVVNSLCPPPHHSICPKIEDVANSKRLLLIIAKVQLCLCVTHRSWQKLFAGKNFGDCVDAVAFIQ